MISGDPWLSTIKQHQWLCGAAARGTPKKKKLARSNASWEDLVTIVNCFLKKKKKAMLGTTLWVGVVPSLSL